MRLHGCGGGGRNDVRVVVRMGGGGGRTGRSGGRGGRSGQWRNGVDIVCEWRGRSELFGLLLMKIGNEKLYILD